VLPSTAQPDPSIAMIARMSRLVECHRPCRAITILPVRQSNAGTLQASLENVCGIWLYFITRTLRQVKIDSG
jgi:hypothetical protein